MFHAKFAKDLKEFILITGFMPVIHFSGWIARTSPAMTVTKFFPRPLHFLRALCLMKI